MSDFEATFEREGSQRGAPRSFAATLQYSAKPGAPVEQRVVSVNAPLRVDGAKVFLVGHGYAPHIKVTDSTGRVVFDDTVVFLPQDGSFTSSGVVKAPDGTPQLGLQALFAPTAALDAVQGPHSTFPAPDDPALFFSAWSGDLGLDAGTPRNVFSLDTDGLEQLGLAALRPGESWDIPGGQGTVEFVGLDRWASFTISRDPGKVLALAAAISAIARPVPVAVRAPPPDLGPGGPDGAVGGDRYPCAVPGAGRRPDPLGLSRRLRRGGSARDQDRWTRGCQGGDMSLAQWSNLFVYGSMAMYAIAMVAFAASFASARAGSVSPSPAQGEDAPAWRRSPWPWVPSIATAPRMPGRLPAPMPGPGRVARMARPLRRLRRSTRPCPPAVGRATSGCR